MIGIVVVSHSRALGLAAAELAAEMVPAETRPHLEVAAGLDETTFGTDATAIADAITAADSPDGVLVLVDLGSALLSSEMALEFIDPEVAGHTVISEAPLVEGLIAALVTAGTGAGLAEVAAEAASALRAKQEQLNPGGAGDDVAAGGGATGSAGSGDGTVPPVVFTCTIRNPHGLHARPAATLVAGLRGLAASVELVNATSGKGPVPATSLTLIQTLGLRRGDEMRALIRGEGAEDARARLAELAAGDFGEREEPGPGVPGTPGTAGAPGAVGTPGTLGTPETPGTPGTPGTVGTPGTRAAQAAPPGAGGSTQAVAGDHDPAAGTEGLNPAAPTAVTEGQTPTAPTAGSHPADPARTGRQIAIGPAHHVAIDPDVSGYRPGDPATESARLAEAVERVGEALRVLAQGPDKAVYTVQELILTDEVTAAALEEAIGRGASATTAVAERYTAIADQLGALDDPYLRARAEDQRGVARMLSRALTGQAITPGLAAGIVVLDELDPATAGVLDPALCLGIITTSGGSTGHGALIAESRGFALLTGRAEAAAIPDGTLVAIDPVENRLWIDPDSGELDDLRGRADRRAAETAAAARNAHAPAVTADGRRILVEANLSSLQDAHDARAAGADGCGLVRTEVVFGNWDRAPSPEEQAAVYVAMSRALGGQTIVVRTWDPGGDKPIAFLPQDRETNPMLGERGIRVMRRLPDLFDDQLTAVLLASREVPVRVMFPMIALPESMVWARERLAAVQARTGGRAEVGMMVETPAAALRAADFRELADFVSIGTNDLTQYTLAVDRGNPRVAQLADGSKEAVWDLIAMTARAFAGRPVAVCGDMASQPAAVARLIALGVTELSVRPPLVGVIKQAVREAAGPAGPGALPESTP